MGQTACCESCASRTPGAVGGAHRGRADSARRGPGRRYTRSLPIQAGS
jgi:hypothetical protein